MAERSPKIKSCNLDENAAKPVEAAATYLTNNSRLLHYDRALAQGLPIATGVIEGACRYAAPEFREVQAR